jgi:hypothetical protein
LALSFLEGRNGADRNGKHALDLFQRACDLAFAGGCGNLGLLLYKDHREDVRAIGLLTRACDGEWWDGCFFLGDIYFSARHEDLALARGVLERPCKAGHQKSCAELGIIYQLGKGVTKDEGKAMALFQPACAAGVAFACTGIGNILVAGGAARDISRARDAYEKGCTDDYPGGCYAFGVVSARGALGQDYLSRAGPLLLRACEHGHADACAFRAKQLEDGAP